MKELSIEEKAKAYDEAKARMSKAFNSNRCTIGFMNEIFPELAESEDEKMIKSLSRLVKAFYDVNFPTPEGFERKDILAWIEKQGEQKSADSKIVDLDELVIELEETIGTSPHSRETIKDFFQKAVQKYMKCLQIANGEIGRLMDENYCLKEQKPWSEEDEDKLNNVIIQLQVASNIIVEDEINDSITFVESLKDRVQLQTWQEWTKEDKERYKSCLQRLSAGNPEQPETINSKWFKEHVYPQSTWKPSDEQMEVLLSVIIKGCPKQMVLESLYQYLKKLKG